jgi:hypothetical protein
MYEGQDKMIDFCIRAFGNFCNSSPVLQVASGAQVLWCGKVSGYKEIQCQVPLHQSIVISGIGKISGEQGVFDTYLGEQGTIVNDKYLQILDISINDISMGQHWLTNLDIISDVGHQKFISSTFWFNGKLCFSIDEPILDWIIEKKYIQFSQNSDFDVDFRSGQGKFDYRPMIKQIQKIKSILNDSDPNL